MTSSNVALMLVRRGDTDRTLAEITSDDILNVKDFNAKGDGATDDTAAIQACFDMAWGATPPHNAPPHDNTTFGMSGNRVVYFPAGKYMTSDSLRAYDVQGGGIAGDGKHASQIECTGASKDVIWANPFTFFTIQNISLKNAGATPITCLNVSRRDSFPTSTTSNAVMLINCAFAGGVDAVRLGELSPSGGTGQEQTSEWLFINCDISGGSRSGVWLSQLNVLNIGFVGCHIFNNAEGIQGNTGHASYIYGCHFEGNASYSAVLTIGSPHNVIGCWSSDSQVTVSGVSGDASGLHASLEFIGLYHDAAASSLIGSSPGRMTLDCCWSKTGDLQSFGTPGTFTNLYLRGNRFGRSDYVTSQPYPNQPGSIKEDFGNIVL